MDVMSENTVGARVRLHYSYPHILPFQYKSHLRSQHKEFRYPIR